MTSRIPSLLENYLALPPETSQILITGILGASTNWLVLRYLYSFLSVPPPSADSPAHQAQRNLAGIDTRVLLVSFLREFAFWRDGASRLGVDLEALGRAGRFGFVDGLSGLFTGVGVVAKSGRDRLEAGAPVILGAGAVGDRHSSAHLLSARQPLPSARQAGLPTTADSSSWHRTVNGSKITDVSAVLDAAVGTLRAGLKGAGTADGKVVVVIDQLDLLLATTPIDVQDLRDLVLNLREKVHATILTLAADEPLVIPQASTLEKKHASLALSLAHESEMLLSLRLLDSGTAKDVSGVIRISHGGQDSSRAVEEKEYLYHVGGEGGARVFERG